MKKRLLSSQILRLSTIYDEFTHYKINKCTEIRTSLNWTTEGNRKQIERADNMKILFFILLTTTWVTASFGPMTFALFTNHGLLTAWSIGCWRLIGFHLQQMHRFALIMRRWWVNDGSVGHRCAHRRRNDRMIAVNNHGFVIFNGGRRVQVNTSAILQAFLFQSLRVEGIFVNRIWFLSLPKASDTVFFWSIMGKEDERILRK